MYKYGHRTENTHSNVHILNKIHIQMFIGVLDMILLTFNNSGSQKLKFSSVLDTIAAPTVDHKSSHVQMQCVNTTKNLYEFL